MKIIGFFIFELIFFCGQDSDFFIWIISSLVVIYYIVYFLLWIISG